MSPANASPPFRVYDDTARFEFLDPRSKAFYRFPLLLSESVLARFSRALRVTLTVFRISDSMTALQPSSLFGSDLKPRILRPPSFDEFPFVRCGSLVSDSSDVMLDSVISPPVDIFVHFDSLVSRLSTALGQMDSRLLVRPGFDADALGVFRDGCRARVLSDYAELRLAFHFFLVFWEALDEFRLFQPFVTVYDYEISFSRESRRPNIFRSSLLDQPDFERDFLEKHSGYGRDGCVFYFRRRHDGVLMFDDNMAAFCMAEARRRILFEDGIHPGPGLIDSWLSAAYSVSRVREDSHATYGMVQTILFDLLGSIVSACGDYLEQSVQSFRMRWRVLRRWHSFSSRMREFGGVDSLSNTYSTPARSQFTSKRSGLGFDNVAPTGLYDSASSLPRPRVQRLTFEDSRSDAPAELVPMCVSAECEQPCLSTLTLPTTPDRDVLRPEADVSFSSSKKITSRVSRRLRQQATRSQAYSFKAVDIILSDLIDDAVTTALQHVPTEIVPISRSFVSAGLLDHSREDYSGTTREVGGANSLSMFTAPISKQVVDSFVHDLRRGDIPMSPNIFSSLAVQRASRDRSGLGGVSTTKY